MLWVPVDIVVSAHFASWAPWMSVRVSLPLGLCLWEWWKPLMMMMMMIHTYKHTYIHTYIHTYFCWYIHFLHILFSQIIFFCTACSVDRAFGILFRKKYPIYRSLHIFISYIFFWLYIFLQFMFICSERRVIHIYILRFILHTSEWVLPFRAYPVKYIKLYFTSIYYLFVFFTFVIYIHRYLH
jgi:hypothetical protein